MSVSRIDRTARVIHGDLPFTYRVVNAEGIILIEGETLEVCAAVADAYNVPERWAPTEAYEIADGWHARRRQEGKE